VFGLLEPAKAQNCQTVQTASGGTVQSCDGGGDDGDASQSQEPRPTPEARTEARRRAVAAGQNSYLDDYIWWATGGEDPAIDLFKERDHGTRLRSTSGIVSGETFKSDTTDVGAIVDGHVDASRVFNLGSGQRLAVGGMFRYDWFDREYDANSADVDRNIYNLAGLFRYDAGNTYFGGGFGGQWGDGSWTDNISGARGDFDSDGFVGAMYLGRIFTLADHLRYAPAGKSLDAPAEPIGGYSVNLDANGYIGYAREEIDGFTDSLGFVWGRELQDYWSTGGRLKLFMTLPGERYSWSPYVAATLNDEFDFAHTIKVPAQDGFARDTLIYGDAQTFWGA
jgi:hypothetical protein